MTVRILQLTDLHLMQEPSARLVDVPTHDSLSDVLEYIRTTEATFDAVILTGDLTHDGLPESYQHVRELLGDDVARCHAIPGNHDDRAAMRQVLPEAAGGELKSVTFSMSAGGWRLIGLDSLVDGEVFGHVGVEQLDWLQQQLTTHSDEPTLLFIHHPPVDIGSEWLDNIGLREADSLIELISAFDQVQLVCAGHVHQQFEQHLGNAIVLTSPSTGVQFEPGTIEPRYEHIAPGYRVIELNGSEFHSEVVRLPELRYPPEG